MEKDIKELLEEVQTWMMTNDYECGDWGGDIFSRIGELLEDEA